MQCTQPLNRSNWCTFTLWATFSKARNAVIYSVGSLSGSAKDRSTSNVLKPVGACKAGLHQAVMGTCISCTSMIRFRCLDKYRKTMLQLLAQLDWLSNALASQNGRGLGGYLKSKPLATVGGLSLHRACITK